MKKEKFNLGILGSLFLITCIKLVSAASSSNYVMVFIDWINSNYGPLFGALLGHEALDEFLFAKVLILFLIFAVVFMSLKRLTLFRHNRPVMFLVAAIVSILSVRFLKENELITGILLPYGAFGASLMIFLPLIIYFMFVHSSIQSGFGRRAAWFIYGSVFLILWGMRTADIGTSNWIYTLGLIFVIISLIFDRSIHKYFEFSDFSRARRNIRRERAIEIIDKIKKARNAGLNNYAEELEEEYKDLIRRAQD